MKAGIGVEICANPVFFNKNVGSEHELGEILNLLRKRFLLLFIHDLASNASLHPTSSTEECRKAIELNPELYFNYDNAWWNYYYLGNFPQTIEFLQKYLTKLSNLKPEYNHYSDSVKSKYSEKGMDGVLNWLIEKELNNWGSKFETLALLCLKAGEKEKALKLLEKGFEMHDINIVRIISIYDYRFLNNEPRYQEIVKNMGLTEYLNKALAASELPL